MISDMLAIFDGQDYTIVTDISREEINKLTEGRLESDLMHSFSDEKWGKKVVLELGENNGVDGIKLKLFPENSAWVDVKEIRVEINQKAYRFLLDRGNFGTRYNGSDKIDFINDNPADFMPREY